MRSIVGGNWKMNTDLAGAVRLAAEIVAGCVSRLRHCDVVIYPPFPYLKAVGDVLGDGGVRLGAQDVFHQPDGAFTGEVSCAMLLDLHVRGVLVGHSERRLVIGEDDDLVNAKALAAVAAGLQVVLCVGETLEQREAGRTEEVTLGQVRAGLRGVPAAALQRLVIAYEPVWAIGTGRTARPRDAALVHRLIRGAMADLYDGGTAGAVRVQYGGSVKAANAADLFAEDEINGALVGGASLDSGQFVAIVHAAADAAARKQRKG